MNDGIWTNLELRNRVFQALDSMTTTNKNNGRPGMDYWKILVPGTLRLVTNCDYDRLKEMANEHGTLRKMLGHGPYCTHSYHIQTLQDNISHFTPEILDLVSQVVVDAGHELVKKRRTVTWPCRFVRSQNGCPFSYRYQPAERRLPKKHRVCVSSR